MSSPNSFRAWIARTQDENYQIQLETIGVGDLPQGDVLIRVNYSTLNYKDGLALTRKGKIIHHFPLVPGIDVCGTVVESESPDYRPGDRVVATGWGLGEDHWGGFSEYARLKSEWLIPLPNGLSLADSMAIGTAGFTAALCVDALQEQGLVPDRGSVLVTGAAGGVGSIAVALLAKRGFHVIAATGRQATHDYLKGIGAAEVIDRSELSEARVRPLDRQRWAGVVDTVGGKPLASAISHTAYGGVVTMCGMAASVDFTASVFPFILRAVRLVGVESVYPPKEKRIRLWADMARDLGSGFLQKMSDHVAFADLPQQAERIVAGGVRGRLVVDINPEQEGV